MSNLLQDLRYAFRMLLKKPGFTLVAVLTLALGVGANTAIFTVVNGVILRPLPYPEPERLVRCDWQLEKYDEDAVTALVFEFWKVHTRSFEAAAGYAGINSGFNLAGGAEPLRVRGIQVSEGFFRVLGIGPTVGRGFLAEEDRPGGSAAVVVSDGLWRTYFGSDRTLVGKEVLINGRGHTVVGILPPGFQFESPIDVLLPLQSRADVDDDGQNTGMIARLRPGISRARAQAEVAQLLPQFRRQYPKHLHAGERGMRLDAYQQWLTGDTGRTLWLMFGAVGFVLLIACANVANLLLARGAARKGEIAVRQALGASRWRLIRQLLTESWLLALSGSIAGIFVALWSVPALLTLAPNSLPRLSEIRVDYQAVSFAIGASLLTSLLFGIAPAFRSTGMNVSEVVKASSGRVRGSKLDSRLLGLLVVSEIALSLVLLVGAALLIKSFLRLRAVETGFEAQQVMTAQVSLTSTKYQTTQQVWAFEQRVLARVASLPGVAAAATSSNLPMERGLNEGMKFMTPSGPAVRTVQFRAISAQYFRTLEIPILRGREFDETDFASSKPVILINETLARQYWPNRSAVGEKVGRRDIVGIVRDVREAGLDKPVTPTVYVPVSQVPDGGMRTMNGWFLTGVIVRASGPANLPAALRQAVKEADPQLPLASVRPLTQVIGASLRSREFILLLMGIFAGLALVLAAVGIYGVLSYQVSQRTHEIGTRMALGAKQSDVLKLVVGQGVKFAIAGIGIGLLVALGLTRLITHLLFGISATDPATFAVIALLLAGMALLACYIPARRAAKVDPMVALRYE